MTPQRPQHLFLRKMAFIASSIILLVLGFRGPFVVETAQAQNTHLEARLLAALNTFRTGAGLSPLTLGPRLACAARAHARDLAHRGELDHRGQDGSDLTQRLSRIGYPYALAAENLAQAGDNILEILALWRDSPGHDRNLRRAKVQDAGVGHAQGPDGHHYWVLILATKATSTLGKHTILGDCQTILGAPHRIPPNQK
jgi:uncharacterized protein YkwD